MIPIYVWGNRHCLEHGKFEEIVSNQISKQKRFNKPEFHLKREQCLSHKFIKNLKRLLIRTHNQPQVHVIVLGNVELINGKTIYEVIQRFTLINELSEINPNSYFVISALVLEEKIDDKELKNNCLFINSALHRTFTSNNRITFVNIDNKLEPESFATPTRLNKIGEIQLAQMISKAIYCIPNMKL
jgi:hypothetical protein